MKCLSQNNLRKSTDFTDLLHQVCNIRQDGQMPGAFDGRGHLALVFERVAGDAARQELALFVDELEKEHIVFVVDMFNPEFAEAAIFCALQAHFWVREKFDIFASCHDFFYFFVKNWWKTGVI